MRLPPEQYSELDPELITPLGGNRFRLDVPRLALFNVWLEPVVDIAVSLADAPPRVILQAERCNLQGCELVQRMDLNRRFALHFSTDLTWTPGTGAPDAGDNGGGRGAIHGDLKLSVVTEVVAPFTLLPRGVLEGTCNAVLRGVMQTMLPMFLRQLAADYERWSSEPEYRARRAATAAGRQEVCPKS